MMLLGLYGSLNQLDANLNLMRARFVWDADLNVSCCCKQCASAFEREVGTP